MSGPNERTTVVPPVPTDPKGGNTNRARSEPQVESSGRIHIDDLLRIYGGSERHRQPRPEPVDEPKNTHHKSGEWQKPLPTPVKPADENVWNR